MGMFPIRVFPYYAEFTMDPQLDDIFQVTFRSIASRDIALNVRHYKVTGVVGAGTTALVAANMFHSVFGPIYAGIMSTDSYFYSALVQKIHPLPLATAVESTLASNQGTRVFDILPNQVCGSITLTTALAGQGYRGRLYVPYPTEDDNDDGHPNAAYILSLAGFATQLHTSIVAGGVADNVTFSPVLWKRETRTETPVLSAVVRDYWTTQRRRNNRRF